MAHILELGDRGRSPTLIAAASAAFLAASVVATPPTRDAITEYSMRCAAERVRADFIAQFGTDFSGLDLSGVDFRGYHYVGFSPILSRADFSGADLTGASFGSARLNAADFTGANLSGASFVTADLTGAVLIDTKLDGTIFQECDLSDTHMPRANLSKTRISGTCFARAQLVEATISGAENEYWWSDFRGADLSGADLSGMDLRGARFAGATLRSVRLAGANLQQADFRGADLEGTDLTAIEIDAAIFDNVRGLDAATVHSLRDRAQRWKFDLSVAVSGFLTIAYLPTYLAIVLAVIVFSALAARDRQRHRAGTVKVVAASVINGCALGPALVLVIMWITGGSPVAQISAGDALAESLWEVWFNIWPAALLFSFAAIPTTLVLLGWVIIDSVRGTPARSATFIVLLVLTSIHLLLLHRLLVTNFPDA